MRGAGRDGCHIGICVALIQHIRPCYADKSNCGGIKRQFRERCLHLLNHLFGKVRYFAIWLAEVVVSPLPSLKNLYKI